VKHIILTTDDMPAVAPCVDRRRTPDRRDTWRGGRRNDDWLNRPPDAWVRVLTGARQPARWRQLLSSLNLW
jgi:hypothetical protein